MRASLRPAMESTTMFKVKVIALLISLIGTLTFLRAYYLVGFAAGYGIKEADRNLLLFRCGAIVCGLVFVWCGISLLLEVFRRRG